MTPDALTGAEAPPEDYHVWFLRTLCPRDRERFTVEVAASRMRTPLDEAVFLDSVTGCTACSQPSLRHVVLCVIGQVAEDGGWDSDLAFWNELHHIATVGRHRAEKAIEAVAPANPSLPPAWVEADRKNKVAFDRLIKTLDSTPAPEKCERCGGKGFWDCGCTTADHPTGRHPCEQCHGTGKRGGGPV